MPTSAPSVARGGRPSSPTSAPPCIPNAAPPVPPTRGRRCARTALHDARTPPPEVAAARREDAAAQGRRCPTEDAPLFGLESHEDNASHYTTRVPKDYHHFVTKYPANKFYLEFPEIFRMFNLDLLESSLVRLWSMYLVRETRQNKELANVGVADPYHMHDDNLSTDEGMELILRECIFPALQNNKDKKYILVPYNPTLEEMVEHLQAAAFCISPAAYTGHHL